MSSIVLTGSNGFLGKNLLLMLSNLNPDIDLVLPYRSDNMPYDLLSRFKNAKIHPYNISSAQHVSQMFKAFDIDTVIHLAAKSSARNGSYELLEENLKTTFNLLEFSPRGTRFIFASSILVYDTTLNGGFTESDRTKPSTIYGLSKLACENLINIYANNGKIRPIILRFCGLVGKYLSHGRIFEALKGKQEFNLFGKSPGNYLPYLHVTDACKAIYNSLEFNKFKLTANICPEDNISLEELLKIINPNVKLNWDNQNLPSEYINAFVETANYELDNWSPTYNSRDAILQAKKEHNENP